MAWPDAEADLLPPMERHMRGLAFRVAREVRVNQRIADLYAWRNDGLTVAVELKLDDWREGLAQAMTYQVGAKASYLAVPLTTAQRILRHRTAVERTCVGLYAIAPPGSDPEVRELLPPKPTQRYLPFTADRAVAMARAGSRW